MAEKSKLDTIANIAIIVVCVIAATVLIRNQFFPPRPPGPPQAEKGDVLEPLQKVLPAGTEKALVIAVSPTCGFCDQSIPFYKRLVDERNKKGSNVKVVVAVPSAEAREPEAKKFADAGATPDALVEVSFAEIKVPGTPTVLLVDNEGKVLEDIWVGKQDEGGEAKILRTL